MAKPELILDYPNNKLFLKSSANIIAITLDDRTGGTAKEARLLPGQLDSFETIKESIDIDLNWGS